MNKQEIIDEINKTKEHLINMEKILEECEYKRLWYKKQLKHKEQECEELKEELKNVYDDCKGCPTCDEALYNANLYAKEYRKFKRTLIEIMRFFKEDEKFARYSGRPIIFAKPTLEKIEKILKENDIKINQCNVEGNKENIMRKLGGK